MIYFQYLAGGIPSKQTILIVGQGVWGFNLGYLWDIQFLAPVANLSQNQQACTSVCPALVHMTVQESVCWRYAVGMKSQGANPNSKDVTVRPKQDAQPSLE